MVDRSQYLRSRSLVNNATGTTGGPAGMGFTPPPPTPSTNFGSSIGTSGVGTNVSNIQGPIIDPKADEDAGVYEADKNLFDSLKNIYQTPQETYSPTTEVTMSDGTTKTVSALDMVGIDADTVADLGFFDERIGDEENPLFLSDELLKFYGIDPASFGMGSGGLQIPKELYQMIVEGSLVTPMEAMQSGESGIGTYSDLEAGVHPLLGGLDKYYNIMSDSSFAAPATGGGGGSITPGGGGSSYGAGIASGLLNQRPKQLGDDENIPAQLRLLQYMVNVHRGNPYTKLALRKKDGGLATIVGD